MHVAISVTLVFNAVPDFAWNALGHKVVAEIAWRQLDPATRQSIVETLRRHPRYDADFAANMTDDVLRGDKAAEDQWIFQHAATWPVCVIIIHCLNSLARYIIES